MPLELSRRQFLATSATATVLATAGCLFDSESETTSYRSYGYGPENSGATGVTAPTGEVIESWLAEDASGAPVVADGQVYTLGSDGSTVLALDAESGERQWEAGLESGVSSRSFAVVDETLYCVDIDGTAHAFATEDGSRNWEQRLPNDHGPKSYSLVADDALIFGLGNQDVFAYHGLYALETADGSIRWHKEPETGDGNRPRTPVCPGADDQTVYLGSVAHNHVTAVSTEDGSTEWSDSVGQSPGYTGFSLTDEYLVCSGYEDAVVIDRESRERVSQIETFGASPPTTDGDQLFARTVDGDSMAVAGFDPESGDQLWKGPDEMAEFGVTPPILAGDGVYYWAGGQVRALDVEEGTELWIHDVPGSIESIPVVVDDSVYVSSDAGMLALESG